MITNEDEHAEKPDADDELGDDGDDEAADDKESSAKKSSPTDGLLRL